LLNKKETSCKHFPASYRQTFARLLNKEQPYPHC